MIDFTKENLNKDLNQYEMEEDDDYFKQNNE